MPQGGHPDPDPQPRLTPVLQFHQRQVGLGFNPTLQRPVMIGQPGTPMAANLFGAAVAGLAVLFPKTLDAPAAHPKSFTNRAGAFTPFAGGDDSPAQILA